MRGRLLLLVVLVLFLILLGLAVLAGKQQTPDAYLQGVKTRGSLRVGIDPTFPPFTTVKNGEISGYDTDIARQIAADIGVKVEFVPLALDTMYDALQAGKVDVLISALPFVYERQKEVRYSQPYYQAGQVLVVKAGSSSIKGLNDLAGRSVAVELGSGADTEARRLARTSLPTVLLHSVYRSPDEAMDAVANLKEDACITDNLSAETYIAAHPGSLAIVLPPLTDEPYVVAMPVKAEALANSVNATIDRLRSSGDLARLLAPKR